jgi:negative regulator of flagellin synthesis FlgM
VNAFFHLYYKLYTILSDNIGKGTVTEVIIMKINGVTPSKVISIYSATKKSDVKETQKAKADSIEISSLGKSLSNMSLEDNFQVSEKRIEEIRNSVTQGTYKPDARLVAQRMMNLIKGREE